MELQALTTFFMWCTIINGGLLALSAAFCVLAPNFVYDLHGKWFPMARETFNGVLYALIGFYKILFIVFCAVPYVALLIIG